VNPIAATGRGPAREATTAATRAGRAPWWTLALAAVVAMAALFVGFGAWTTYFWAYTLGMPVLLLGAQLDPLTYLAAFLLPLLLVAACIRFLAAPRIVGIAVPLAYAALFAVIVAVSAALGIIYDGWLTSVLRSDLVMLGLCAAGAYLGSVVAGWRVA
jgi:hypothetical protein